MPPTTRARRAPAHSSYVFNEPWGFGTQESPHASGTKNSRRRRPSRTRGGCRDNDRRLHRRTRDPGDPVPSAAVTGRRLDRRARSVSRPTVFLMFWSHTPAAACRRRRTTLNSAAGSARTPICGCTEWVGLGGVARVHRRGHCGVHRLAWGRLDPGEREPEVYVGADIGRAGTTWPSSRSRAMRTSSCSSTTGCGPGARQSGGH